MAGSDLEKVEAEVSRLNAVHTHVDNETIADLPQEHRDYLLKRYGTLELDPIPDMSDADPYNWPYSRKIVNLTLVAFHAMMATFTSAAIQSAFSDIAEDLHTSVTKATYLTSLFIAVLGVAPLLWRPLADRFGRRPIFLISLVCSLAGNIGCANSPTYATMAVCRAITAFFISPAQAIGSAVVAECFFKKDRGRYIGLWTLFVTLGIPTAPFLFGFVAQRVGYRWIYYVLAITNGAQLILYTFLGPETRYVRSGVQHIGSSLKQRYFSFHRINPQSLTWYDFVQPLALATRSRILLPTITYSMVFVLASVMVTVEMPALFVVKFNLDSEQLGLQFLSVMIGSLIGEQLSGWLSDWFMDRKRRKFQQENIGEVIHPEHRLWLSYSGFLLSICGLIVFLVRTEQATALHWNITPLIGAGIASAGNQIVFTVMITYAVDCYREEAAGIGVFITLVRHIWGFIGPFWFPPMFTSVGLYGSAGIVTGLLVAFSIVPTVYLQWRGNRA